MLPTKERQREWKNSPIKFIKDQWGLIPQPLECEEEHEHTVDCFGIFERGKHLTWQQHEILLGIEKSLRGEAPRRISVAAGHGIGKSCVLAWITIWFLMTRKGAQIGATSPTRDQIYDVLWKEISVWHRKLDKEIQDLFIWQATYFRVAQSPNTWFARARTARKEAPEAFAGLHGPAVALLGDEASGVIDEVYRVAEGSLTDKDTLVILISNFTRLEGYFYDTHNSDKANWQRFSFSSIDSPIVKSDFAERIAVKYGSDSDEYRYMVLGLPPKGEGMVDGWLPMFTEDDISKQVADIGSWMKPTYMGVDPSGQGANKTVWTIRDAFRMKVLSIEKKSNTLDIAEQIVSASMHHEIKPQNVKIDNFGVGANISQEIALGVHERVHSINVGNKPRDDRFINIRAEMFWLFREWLKKGGKLVKHEGWRQLLTIRYKRTLAGKIQIMSKEEMIKKGWESCDVADAGALTFVPADVGRETTSIRTPIQDVDTQKITDLY